jgi:Flp pilus assembly protein TadG
MLRRFKIYSRCEGIAAVEFGLIMPVFLLILAGLFDFGWGFYWKHNVTNASRAGARYAVQAKVSGGTSTPYNETEIKTKVQTDYGNDLVVTVNPVIAGAIGTSRSVTVTKPMTYFWGSFLSGLGIHLPTTISNRTSMTME